MEKGRGSIKTGKYADFILIDQNVLTCFPMSIYRTNVTAIFFEGKQVYERKAE
ncbi:MAG: hypothetical protein K5764_07235 [Prevotella sp.]|nr:hypothetical protein [Prevotella sp.]